MKIFVDNDVILDLLLERKDFEYSKSLLTQIEKRLISAYTSPIIFTNSFYVVSKLKNKKVAWSSLKKIRLLFKISTINEKIVDLALASSFADFEDAVQYYCALNEKVDYLITRNKKDFIETQVDVITPKEYFGLEK